jgi:hypothetical protein
MKITEMNNCIEEMRKCYKFEDNKTEITLGDSTSRSARDSFDKGNYGILHIVTADELK